MSASRVAVRVDARPSQWACDVIERLRARDVCVDIIPDIARESRAWFPMRWISGTRLRSGATVAKVAGTKEPAQRWLDLRRRPSAGAAPPSTECWALAIGDGRYALPAFDEALAGAWQVDVQLRAARGSSERVVRRAVFPYASRYGRTLDLILGECLTWFDAPDAPTTAMTAIEARPTAEPITLRLLARFVLAEVRRMANLALRRAFEEARWNVGIAKVSLEQFLDGPSETRFEWVANANESLADPFPVHVGDRTDVLCESIGTDRKGSIVAIDAATCASRSTILNGATHVSYPFAFCVGERTFVLPERAKSGRLDLFELSGGAVSLVSTMIAEHGLIDPTLTFFGGRFWLFGTNPHRLPNATLHAYWSDSPFGPWRPHARNPVKIDITSARPAGRMFWREGVLYRPAQDCSGRYGRAVVINRIDRLDPEAFEETAVARIDPATLGLRDSVGVHTLTASEPYVTVDAQYVSWSWTKPLAVTLARARAYFAERKPCAT